MTTARHKIASGLTAAIGGGIILVGARFLRNPEAGAKGFGIPAWLRRDANAYLVAKGVRDIATGLIALVLLAMGQRRALGWVSLTATLIPASDAAIVLRHKGSPAIAYGVHGATAAVTLINGLLLLGEKPEDG